MCLSKKEPSDNFFWYMREGIIESTVHELIHGYITNYRNIDRLLHYIRNGCRNDIKNTCKKLTYYNVEEPFVNNTSISFFRKSGGISKSVINFYTYMFMQYQRNILKECPSFKKIKQNIIKNRNDNVKINDYPNLFKLPIFD